MSFIKYDEVLQITNLILAFMWEYNILSCKLLS